MSMLPDDQWVVNLWMQYYAVRVDRRSGSVLKIVDLRQKGHCQCGVYE